MAFQPPQTIMFKFFSAIISSFCYLSLIILFIESFLNYKMSIFFLFFFIF
ncbi:hypothetical protein HMPREF1871_00783 [Gemelliphila asaccharolytica]|uniref:ATP synthase F0 subunit 8 n=1 Tax=Gemelliphila asaccharolytica TaxID=502393 RepID=A0ABR5TLK5_9BACL|nr:hypothetical protein HMPREF1871_00783 [Gemella asaccharolytica]